MGKKKEEAVSNAAAAEKPVPDEEEEEEEDTPTIKELKKLDDQYLAIEREYEAEVQRIQKQYSERQEPLLKKRTEILVKGLEESNAGNEALKTETGTPALEDFWLTALSNLPQCDEEIQEHDKPVLSYLRDITKEQVDPDDSNKGFKLIFEFVENPYFTNRQLSKEYVTAESSPYTGEIETTEIKATSIDWKPGKNVTVEMVKKKAKGGGAKKNTKKAKESEEPRDSFFRSFFRNLKEDMAVPEDVRMLMEDEDEDEDDDENLIELLMENDYELGCGIRDMLIPFAVRWYTGEARPDDDDDDEDEEEEEDDEDDDDDEDEDEPPKRAGRSGHKPRGGGPKPKAGAGADGEENKECKQQ